jgi:MtN3 and saliva related transmembrane protein
MYMFDTTQMIGYFAGILTTAAFLPQVVKTIRDKSTRDISFSMYLLFCAGIFLWLVYGLLLQDMPIIASNVVTLLLAGIILGLKSRHG